jgi:hypothetical protein
MMIAAKIHQQRYFIEGLRHFRLRWKSEGLVDYRHIYGLLWKIHFNI